MCNYCYDEGIFFYPPLMPADDHHRHSHIIDERRLYAVDRFFLLDTKPPVPTCYYIPNPVIPGGFPLVVYLLKQLPAPYTYLLTEGSCRIDLMNGDYRFLFGPFSFSSFMLRNRN